ncbi:MAG TPA: ATP-binding cassette domain-containing protein [Acidimicrobiia bacterium]|jgi:daunorubicin resistance ABC transporter ATP-binding subunit|nr:ATP-binding cassette domain-containing protein [Acidimicrobiia bacterium]
MAPIIEADGLTQNFGDVQALSGVTFDVDAGTVYGLLGPNGAGKTTTVRILTTLLTPSGGSARVAGFDVARQPEELRRAIGLAGQYAAVDEILTGEENLEMVGRLYGLSPRVARTRAQEVLELFDLTEAAGRQVRTYSGGMRRRLDLGASLVGDPEVLFLDEPTTGLDPRSRRDLWEFIERLVGEGTTLLLTTQYLEEADRLADRIGVIDHGRVIAEGTSEELKTRIGGDVIEFQVADRNELEAAVAAVAEIGTHAPSVDTSEAMVQVPVASPVGVITEVVRKLDAHNIKLCDLHIRRPTLDDVFLTLTGQPAAEESEGETVAGQPAPGRRRGQ